MSYPIVCALYCTTRCDNRCRHCQVRSPLPGDADFYAAEKNVREFAKLGGRYIDPTGGNPLLVDWLPGLLLTCGQLRLISTLTISGPMIAKRINDWGEGWLKSPSILRLSVDGDEVFHNRNRGNGYYQSVIEGLEAARKIRKGQKTQLIFTIMPGEGGNLNRDHLASVLQLAREHSALVNVNPLFGATSLTSKELEDIKWFSKQADVQLSKGKVRFMMKGGNNRQKPTCQAAKAVLTISSDNKVILPCYHYPLAALPIEKDLRTTLDSLERRKILPSSGYYRSCEGCTVWCYIIPSFLYHLFDRVVVWEHGLSGLQAVRDCFLRKAGRINSNCRYPDFVL